MTMHLGYDCSICHIFVPHRRREKGKENEGIELNFYANFCFFFSFFSAEYFFYAPRARGEWPEFLLSRIALLMLLVGTAMTHF